jgi:sugar/nucleoside kinase (ribokinase family)
LKQFGITTILTRGPRPVLACIGGKVVEFPVERIVPVNPIGSGDAFTAALALGMQRRFPMDRNIALAIACGKANALHVRPGTIAEHPEGSGTILRLLEP